ncbi:archaeal/vacuolar-type H -ATPase subunit I [Cenarchaeum symbiosum A]|uniref:A-type ATP synthase subunit I n=1 Tax=Cenarchaeum symbiosum (strain A) TaxID=414004 RepID=A0RXK6_CENSY|nr:archaeal/vacuolar-type H -ATPase subunit I [Cenarchaeum symbiosum A]
MLGTVILPRSDSPRAISRLAEFDWFHKVDAENETVTPEIDDLLLRAQKVFQSVDDVVKGLGIPPRVGILEILFKGTMFKKKEYELDEVARMVADIEGEAHVTIDEIARLLAEIEEVEKSLEEHRTLTDALRVIRGLDVDLGSFGPMKRFFGDIFLVGSADYPEVERSLEGSAMYRYELDSKDTVAVAVFADARDTDDILRVMRAVNASSFTIPAGFSQVPSKAFEAAEAAIKKLESRQAALKKRLAAMTKKIRGRVLTVHERAMVAKDVLESLRKPGGTRRFAVIQGYIPRNLEGKFKETTGEWMSIVEDLPGEEEKKAPTLFRNPRFVRTFEVITESQGIPKKGELDPTPMIALMWPIFYGIMFADVGHGLLLMGMGLLFKLKGQGNLARWGMLIAISGAAASIAGVGSGEAFGFHIDHLEPFESLLEEGGILHPVSWLVGVMSVAELNFEQVINILKVSLFIGILHLLAAMLLRVRRLYKEGKKLVMYMEAIPNITLYLGIVAIMMCAIGSGYDVINMYSKIHTEPVPWVTIFLGDWAQVWIITRISISVVIASVVIMIIGGMKHARAHPEEGADPASVVMETLLGKTIEALAHTISYARIGIMLLVHAALLLTVNNAFKSLGGIESPGALALIIGGNLGIMMIEGLIVYIQSLRLHLYEYFTKWYDGGNQPFRKLLPEIVYNAVSWKR